MAPTVKNVGYLAYDDTLPLRRASSSTTPTPRAIRAPLGDRDNIASSTDYGGVILDTRNDGRTAILFLANAARHPVRRGDRRRRLGRGLLAGLLLGRRGRDHRPGWTLEIRIPFSSLRYPKADPQTWGVMLYRNYPRDFRYQFFTTRLPRGSNCFICHSNDARRASRSCPRRGHLVVAPYVSARAERDAGRGTRARRSTAGRSDGEAGARRQVDAERRAPRSTPRSTPTSRRSSPTSRRSRPTSASRSSTRRSGRSSSKGIDLFSTPIQAVYTRTITSPRWGVRAHRQVGRPQLHRARRRRPGRRQR